MPKLSCGRSAQDAAHQPRWVATRQAHNPTTPPPARQLQRFVRQLVTGTRRVARSRANQSGLGGPTALLTVAGNDVRACRPSLAARA